MVKKFLLTYAASITLVFAATSEITPMVGGVYPFDTNKFGNHATIGIRAALGIENTLIDQIEIGYDYSREVKYKNSNDRADFSRLYLNAVKELNSQSASKAKIYGLIGFGHEDISHPQKEIKSGTFGQYGIGLKYYFNDHFALRTEIRHAVRFDSGDSNLFYTLGITLPIGGKKTAPVIVQEKEPEQITPSDEPAEQLISDEQSKPNEPITQNEQIKQEENKPVIQKTFKPESDDSKIYIKFNFDETQILDQDKEKIKNIADYLKQNGFATIMLEGHADSKGSKQYNLRLSGQRAEAVKDSFVKQEIEADRIETKGYGKERPLKPNDTKEGRLENRRVEIIIINSTNP